MEKRFGNIGVSLTTEYDDIISMQYPLKNSDVYKHPRMSNADRAKIFSPFAALRGYEDAIAARQRIFVPKVELTEDAKSELDHHLQMVVSLLSQGEHPMIEVIYFEKESSSTEKEEGSYISFTGKVARYIETARILQVVDRKINLDNIRAIRGDFLLSL